MNTNPAIQVSGERFRVIYRLPGNESEARSTARAICVEQTVEYPEALIPEGGIRDHIVGRLESLDPVSGGHEAAISYAVEISGFEIPQLLNVIFGNSSLKPGIRVERLELSISILKSFRGPRFGRKGLRKILDAPRRPLLASALKPLGLPSKDLAAMAYELALGGADIIKDDHGITDQAFAPFMERVTRCSEAVQKANRSTGGRCCYVPNITAPMDKILQNARFAKEAGAGGLLIAPGLTGFDALRLISADDAIALPVFSHPSFLGGFFSSNGSGISHFALFGQILRLAGADAVIYPDHGGRFSFSREECREIVQGTEAPMGLISPIFPMPGGGMSLESVPDRIQTYGRDVILLISGSLHAQGADLVDNVRHFRQVAESAGSMEPSSSS